MKNNPVKALILFFALIFLSFGSHATTKNINIYWADGTLALSCVETAPPSPLMSHVTIISDNSLANGTILYSWGYNDFFPNITQDCTSSGNTSLTNQIKSPSSLGVFADEDSANNVIVSFNDTSLGIRTYIKFNQDSTICNECDSYYNVATSNMGDSGSSSVPGGMEVEIKPFTNYVIKYTPVKDNKTGLFKMMSSKTSFSIRGDLIKLGFMANGGSTPVAFWGTTPSYDNIYLTDGGTPPQFTRDATAALLNNNSQFYVYTPSCRLTTQNYTIPMGNWTVSENVINNYPIVGSEAPVNIELKCSGVVDNVRFKFEDTAPNKLTNKNISLYPSGKPNSLVDGLEIELLYNGTHVDVDNVSETNLGTLGEPVVITYGAIFNTMNTAKFSARYVQRKSITMNGSPFTGPVTGKVNMWLTYD